MCVCVGGGGGVLSEGLDQHDDESTDKGVH